MLEKQVVTIQCSWCGEVVEGIPVLGKPIVIAGGHAHFFRQKGVRLRFEPTEEQEAA